MLSRIMRHPAGFMKKALGRNRLTDPFARPEPPAPPPDYWKNRFSGLGLALLALPRAPAIPTEPPMGMGAVAAVIAPAAAPVGGSFSAAAGALPRHGGKAASFLLAERMPATHP